MLNLLSILFTFTQIRLCPISRFFGFSLGRCYAAISAADSTAVPTVSRFKNISNTFVGVVLIAPVIIIHAALCRRSSSDLIKAMFMPSHHATAAYVIGIITRLHMATVPSWAKVPRSCHLYALHDHRALSPFLTCALMCDVSLSSRMTPGYLTSFVRFSFTPWYSSLTTPSVFLFLVKSNTSVSQGLQTVLWSCTSCPQP